MKMKTDILSQKEPYASPLTRIYHLAMEKTILSNTEPIGGGDNPDNPWPEGGN